MAVAIQKVRALEILDSRGNPTLAVEVGTTGGSAGARRSPRARRPARARRSSCATATRAATAARASRAPSRNVNGEIANAVAKLRSAASPSRPRSTRSCVDLDGTDTKSRLGANALLGVSLAAAHARRRRGGQPLYRWLGGADAALLPAPMMNVINGGAHADNNVDFQEFMIFPLGAPTFAEALRYGAEVFHALRERAPARRASRPAVGDEGGFAPNLASNREASSWCCAPSSRPATGRATDRDRARPAPPASSTRTAATSSRAKARA